jgi:hypothetical protein
MNNPHRITAEIHKATMPNEMRTVEQLESHYRNLSHGSPFARACAELIAEDTAKNAQEFAELTTRATLARATAAADDMGEMIRYGQDLAETWAHLGHAEMVEQIEAHLESSYPEASDEAIAAVVRRVAGM